MTTESKGPSNLLAFFLWLLGPGRYRVLAVLLVLTAFFGFFSFRVKVEQGNESMGSWKEEDLRFYEDFKRTFGSDENILLSVTPPRLLSPDGLVLLDDLTARIANLPGVRRVYSLTNAVQAVPGPGGAEKAPLVPRPFGADGTSGRILSALADNPYLDGLLISRDRRTAGVIIEAEERPGDDRHRGRLIDALRGLVFHEKGKAEFHLTGIGVQKHDVARSIQRDQAVLIPVSILVLGLALALMFRRISGVVLPLAVTGMSLSWTLGIYALAGYSLNTITSLLPPVVMVLSITTSVHLYIGWLRIPEESGDRAGLIARETETLFSPCLYTALTTALGLLSLTVSDIPAVRQFGAAGALGVLVSFAIGITLVPACLSFLPLPGAGIGATGGRAWEGMLQKTARLASARPAAILAVAVLLCLASVAGITRVRNNTDLIRFLKTDAPLYRDTLFIDRNLSGVNSLEFVVTRNDGKPLSTPGDMRRIAAFRELTLRQRDVASAQSVAELVQAIHRAETGEKNSGLPEEPEDLLYALDLLAAGGEEALLRKLIRKDHTAVRVIVRVHAIGTADSAPLAETILRQGKEVLGDPYVLAATGSYYEVTQDSQRLARSLVRSFSLSLVLVMLAIHVLFRSGKLTGIALLPNVIPILTTGGLMGFAGVDLSTATGMIGAVVFGLVVDNTIHYLARYRKEYRGDCTPAVFRTTTGIGRALVTSSLVLVVGFWVGCFGSFKPTIYFSLLTGVTMIVALACDLLVLPACLVLLDSRNRQGSKS